MFTVNKNPSGRDLRWFAIGMLVGFPLISALLIYFSRSRADAGYSSPVKWGLAISLFVLGVTAGLTALASPRVGRKLYIAWMTITLPLGVLMSTLLLSILYFVFLPPFSLIVRRRDPLRKKLGGATYWEDYKPHESSLERMRRPF